MAGDSYLQALVISRCRELGDEKSAEFFEVSPGLIRQWINGSKTPSLSSVEKVFVIPQGKALEAEWEGKDVFIAAPFYKTTNPGTLFSLLAMWDRPKMGFRHRYGDAFIVHARNQLADDYLKSGMPWCFWIDDDTIVPCGSASWFNTTTEMNLPEKFAGMHTINRLRSHGKSLIGGVYFGRSKKGKATYAEAMQETVEGRAENRRAHQGPFDEIRPTEWTGTGCLLHNRDVLLDIQKHNPHLAPQHSSETFHFFSGSPDAVMKLFGEMQQKTDAIYSHVTQGSAAEASKLLSDLMEQMRQASSQVIKDSRLQQGEDQTFCRRAKVAGHQPFIDHGIHCGHLGSNVWAGHNTDAN